MAYLNKNSGGKEHRRRGNMMCMQRGWVYYLTTTVAEKEHRRRGNTMYMQWGWGAGSRLCLRGVGATVSITPLRVPLHIFLFHGVGYPFIRGCAVQKPNNKNSDNTATGRTRGPNGLTLSAARCWGDAPLCQADRFPGPQGWRMPPRDASFHCSSKGATNGQEWARLAAR